MRPRPTRRERILAWHLAVATDEELANLLAAARRELASRPPLSQAAPGERPRRPPGPAHARPCTMRSTP